jgi:N-methylhydantoinase B
VNDPVIREVVRHATIGIAEAMKHDLMRSARSPVLREAGDLSCALTDAVGATVAQGNDIPMHLGVIGFTVGELLARIPANRLADGDVWFVNDPAVGGNHLPDVKAIRPVFYHGRLCAFAVALAHWPDVGGALPGSYVPDAREIYQEGLRMPPVRLFAADGEQHEMLSLVLANVRGPDERLGDIRAQAATTQIAAARLVEVFDAHGADQVQAVWRDLQAESETRVRRALAALPDAVFDGADALDDDGVGDEPVAIRCRVTIAGDAATFDYSASDDAALGPVNTTRFITAASTYYVVKALLAPDATPNAGAWRPVTVVTRPGSVLDAGPTAPVVAGNHETSQRIVDAAMRALAGALPGRVVAAGMGSSGLALFSGRDAHGRSFFLYETHAGGAGASASRDGSDATRIHMSNVMNTPVEVIESEYPLRVEVAEIRRGSGGSGVHHGGRGLRRRYRVLADEMRVTTIVERTRVAPPGLAGGSDGAPSIVWLERDGRRVALRGKGSARLVAGDLIEIETAGGAGFGEEQ